MVHFKLFPLFNSRRNSTRFTFFYCPQKSGIMWNLWIYFVVTCAVYVVGRLISHLKCESVCAPLCKKKIVFLISNWIGKMTIEVWANIILIVWSSVQGPDSLYICPRDHYFYLIFPTILLIWKVNFYSLFISSSLWTFSCSIDNEVLQITGRILRALE